MAISITRMEFYEGNSRTLREFFRELAGAPGYKLDWIGTGAGARERNELYIARDVLVLERAFPGFTRERALETENRLKYEASFVLMRLRRATGARSLETVIRDGIVSKLSPDQR